MSNDSLTNDSEQTGDEAQRLVFAAVADDDTGASDLAGMLAEQALRTLLVLDLPSTEQFAEWTRGYQAVVMAEGTRNLAPADAYERTRAAIRLLQTRRPRTFQIKYCSTFDSTTEGNIGTSIDAALDELGEDFTVALPALPVNGRTTYQGYHFVHRQLLGDSPMRHHPLTPMTNSNLVEHLGRQTRRSVGLAAFQVVQAGAETLKNHLQALRASGVRIALVDCLDDVHLEIICRACADLRLITGSSAFGMKLPAIWRERGLLAAQKRESFAAQKRGLPAAQSRPPVPIVSGASASGLSVSGASRGAARGEGCLLVAGSCSTATLRQNEWLEAQDGCVVRHVRPAELLEGELDRAGIVAEASRALSEGRHYLLTTSGATVEVGRVQAWGARKGLPVPALGEALAYALADVALEVLDAQRAAGLIVAGGETSGALCRRLELGALQVGRNIEPGVPLCYSLGRFRLPVVLKSGNFGSPDFYLKAIEAVAQSEEYLTF